LTYKFKVSAAFWRTTIPTFRKRVFDLIEFWFEYLNILNNEAQGLSEDLLLIDSTSCPIQKPGEHQRKFYSGLILFL